MYLDSSKSTCLGPRVDQLSLARRKRSRIRPERERVCARSSTMARSARLLGTPVGELLSRSRPLDPPPRWRPHRMTAVMKGKRRSRRRSPVASGSRSPKHLSNFSAARRRPGGGFRRALRGSRGPRLELPDNCAPLPTTRFARRSKPSRLTAPRLRMGIIGHSPCHIFITDRVVFK